MPRSRNANDLSDRIRRIDAFDRDTCVDAWTKAFGRPPPRYLSVRFLQRTLIHHVQCQRLGGYAALTKRAMAACQEETPRRGAVRAQSTQPGSLLVREWNGRTYRVTVTEDGYVLDDQVYRSLTAVAERITGAKWSGPRFFGLTPPRAS